MRVTSAGRACVESETDADARGEGKTVTTRLLLIADTHLPKRAKRLPDAVLRKVYYANALRVTPGLPQAGW